MDEKNYQLIFDKISAFLPEEWKTMVYYAIYTSGSYSMKFYYESGNKKYIDCFHCPGAAKVKLVQLFMEIDKLLSGSRKTLKSKEVWTVFTMKVDSYGHMETQYEYDDHTEDMVAYEDIWEKKYLV